MVPHTPTPTEPPARKAVLFCLSCDHQSPVDGDWTLKREGDGLVYRCPACETAITTRSLPTTTPLGTWTSMYTDWVNLWSDWYRELATTPLEYVPVRPSPGN
ncbi:hypothetical protein ACYJ1Y_18005 [Natrialbaceae archaeon A-gly3]